MSANESTGVHAILRSPHVAVTVRSSVWRYLEAEMDPEEDVLVMVMSDSGWLAGVLPRQFPGTPTEAVTAQLDQYTVLFPQPEQMKKLDGHTLDYAGDVLSVV